MAKNDCSFHAQNSKLNPKRDVVEFLEKINYMCQSSNVLRKAKNHATTHLDLLSPKANHECSKRIMSPPFESIQKRLTLGLLVYSSCLAKCSLPIAYSFLVAFISSYSFKGSSLCERALALSAHSLSSKKVLGGRKVELQNHPKCP